MAEARTVFVTVGTTKFDELISTIIQEKTIKALKNRGCNNLIIQVGNGSVIPDPDSLKEQYNITVLYYKFKPAIDEDIALADLVISHAGAGSCMQVLHAEKPLIVVINENLSDNHQTELADQLCLEKNLLACKCESLVETIDTMDLSMINPFLKPDPDLLSEFLDNFMNFENKNKYKRLKRKF